MKGSAAVLLARDPAVHTPLHDLNAVVVLLDTLQWIGAEEQTAVLAERVITHGDLTDALAIAALLEILHRMGEDEQIAALLVRDPATHSVLDCTLTMMAATLLDGLREVGADDQVAVLGERLPVEGHFDAFLTLGGHQKLFRFGREPDGGPTVPWRWKDLQWPRVHAH